MAKFETSPRLRRRAGLRRLADGTIVADVRLSKRGFTQFDVSEEAGQQEVLAAIERHLGY